MTAAGEAFAAGILRRLPALLAVGAPAVASYLRLPEPVNVDPAGLPVEVRAARGIAPLPSSLAEAVAAFEADTVLRDALGEAVTDTVAAVRRGEIGLFDGATPEEIAAATRWRH
jgi:glutamine synthetase